MKIPHRRFDAGQGWLNICPLAPTDLCRPEILCSAIFESPTNSKQWFQQLAKEPTTPGRSVSRAIYNWDSVPALELIEVATGCLRIPVLSCLSFEAQCHSSAFCILQMYILHSLAFLACLQDWDTFKSAVVLKNVAHVVSTRKEWKAKCRDLKLDERHRFKCWKISFQDFGLVI